MHALAQIAPVCLSILDGEPRCRDLDLADRLGFDRPRNIRNLIDRNIAEIESFGSALRREALLTRPQGGTVSVQEYWLNEEQALLVSVLSNAPNAPAVRAMLIKVFVAWRRGQLPQAAPARKLRRGAMSNPTAPVARKRIRNRDDLSFTRRDEAGRLVNWKETPTDGSWHRAYGVGETWFAEIVELARHRPNEACQAMRFAGPELVPYLSKGPRSVGDGYADGFFNQMAKWALLGMMSGDDPLSLQIEHCPCPIQPRLDDPRFF